VDFSHGIRITDVNLIWADSNNRACWILCEYISGRKNKTDGAYHISHGACGCTSVPFRSSNNRCRSLLSILIFLARGYGMCYL
jgi:hypothetical protein